jgi:hypothetical protein
MFTMRVLISALFVATRATQPDRLIHPVTHDNCLLILGGEIMATQWYWPPAVGYAERNSASEAARERLQIPAVARPQTTETEPPEGRARDREAARAVQELRIAKARPSIVQRLKVRLKDSL